MGLWQGTCAFLWTRFDWNTQTKNQWKIYELFTILYSSLSFVPNLSTSKLHGYWSLNESLLPLLPHFIFRIFNFRHQLVPFSHQHHMFQCLRFPCEYDDWGLGSSCFLNVLAIFTLFFFGWYKWLNLFCKMYENFFLNSLMYIKVINLLYMHIYTIYINTTQDIRYIMIG